MTTVKPHTRKVNNKIVNVRGYYRITPTELRGARKSFNVAVNFTKPPKDRKKAALELAKFMKKLG
jgi:hypothetical protein